MTVRMARFVMGMSVDATAGTTAKPVTKQRVASVTFLGDREGFHAGTRYTEICRAKTAADASQMTMHIYGR